jgi:methionyl-tRNA formyltransferase
MGTPAFAVPALEAVAEACEVAMVVTQPDRPRGRGRQTGASEVAEAAGGRGLPIMKADDMRSPSVRAALAALTPDLFAVVAFGAILSPELLEVPRLGSLNLHGSLLPDYRGASPVQRALWDGRAWTGVTTLWMDSGIDTGDVALQRWEPVMPDDTAGTLAERLATLGAPLLAESLTLAHAGRCPRRPQPAGAGSYAGKLAKQDGIIDWSLEAIEVWNRQRAVTPWPGAGTSLGGRRVTITASRPHDLLDDGGTPGTIVEVGAAGVRVACGRGTLRLVRVKPEGRNEMEAAEWARGARVNVGDRFEALAGKETHA